MNTIQKHQPEASEGIPLAVCINDCLLDNGQPACELARICFHVGCAFAPMRWGHSSAAFEALSQNAP